MTRETKINFKNWVWGHKVTLKQILKNYLQNFTSIFKIAIVILSWVY